MYNKMTLKEYYEMFCIDCDYTYDCDCFWIDSVQNCSEQNEIEITDLKE